MRPLGITRARARRGAGLAAILLLVLGAQVGAEEPPGGAARRRGPAYVGSRLCMRCHVKQHKSWLATSHARATEVLGPGRARERKKQANLDPERDYRRDPTCLPCHTTGYDKPGGRPRPPGEEGWSESQRSLAERHAGVGCEACHGAGGRYWRVMDRNPRFRRHEIVRAGANAPVGEDVCRACHDDPCAAADPEQAFDIERCNVPEHVHVHVPLRFPH